MSIGIEKLRAAVRGRVFVDDETRAEVGSDFGRVLRKTPDAVVLPEDAEDICAVVRLANLDNFSISIRGAAHSQGGQCLSDGGVVIDTGSLHWMEDPVGLSVRVGSGLLWADLLKELVPRGLVPPVTTRYLDQTVGGTLSMAGLGASSHRHGAQVDRVLELEVVIGSGEKVSCSRQENPDLFECMRSGLGQFGIITAARLQLRPLRPRVRTWYLLYDDLGQMLRDQEWLIQSARVDAIESWCTPLPLGFRKVGEAVMPFAEWFHPMELSWEFEDRIDDLPVMNELGACRRVRNEESSSMDFLFRQEPVIQHWRHTGSWKHAHPWMEILLPWAVARRYVEGVIANFPPNLLAGGQVQLAPVPMAALETPLLMKPAGELALHFGILPAVPRQQLPLVLPMLKKVSDLGMRLGGKRILSGWVDFTPEQWPQHFGSQWKRLRQWKQFFDPAGVLNPGFIDYSVY